jgi:hypothetical protein
MPELHRGRFSPTPPPRFSSPAATPFVGRWWWNAPRQAITREISSPIYKADSQAQAALSRLLALPACLRFPLQQRYLQLLDADGMACAQAFLKQTFAQRLWPRIQKIMNKNQLKRQISLGFMAEEETYNRLPDLNEKQLKSLAWRVATHCHEAYEQLCDRQIALNNAADSLLSDATQNQLYSVVAGMTRSLNVTPLHWSRFTEGRLDASSAVASLSRLVNADWWRRQLQTQQARWREALMIAGGYVNRRVSAYASKNAQREVRSRRLSMINYLKQNELQNEQSGERINMLETVMSSIANPAIRRMELMTLIAGVEQVASDQGDRGLFITLTTPSKYHPTRMFNRHVHFNSRWDDQAYSPKEAQRYLVAVWAKIRTAFKDQSIKIYGVRVVEPHHDGTPHWHMMLFTTPSQQQTAIDIMRRYALQEEGDEPGAAKNRFDCKPLNRGGAAAYIAKYISKNIDGYALDGEVDFDSGKPLQESASAVTAWASTWRIPQFHPIGLPSVVTYRECRRIRGVSLESHFDRRVEEVRHAADCGDYAGYIHSQGGTNVPRHQQTVRVARQPRGRFNRYAEEQKEVVGIYAPHLGEDRCYQTRSSRWRVVRREPNAERKATDKDIPMPWSSVINCGNTYVLNEQHPPGRPPKMPMNDWGSSKMKNEY